MEYSVDLLVEIVATDAQAKDFAVSIANTQDVSIKVRFAGFRSRYLPTMRFNGKVADCARRQQVYISASMNRLDEAEAAIDALKGRVKQLGNGFTPTIAAAGIYFQGIQYEAAK